MTIVLLKNLLSTAVSRCCCCIWNLTIINSIFNLKNHRHPQSTQRIALTTDLVCQMRSPLLRFNPVTGLLIALLLFHHACFSSSMNHYTTPSATHGNLDLLESYWQPLSTSRFGASTLPYRRQPSLLRNYRPRSFSGCLKPNFVILLKFWPSVKKRPLSVFARHDQWSGALPLT